MLVAAHASVTELTLAELLAERLDAEEASQAWYYERDVLQRRLDDIAELEGLRDFHLLGDWFGSEHAADSATPSRRPSMRSTPTPSHSPSVQR